MLPAVMRRGAGFAILWLVLAEGDLQAWWIGGAAVALATAASIVLMPPHHFLRLLPTLAFLFYFLGNAIRSGLLVALLALDPRRGPRPHCVDVTLTLPAGAPRLIVAGALGLMPGTLSMRLDGAVLKVHALDSALPVTAEIRALEARVAQMIGIECREVR